MFVSNSPPALQFSSLFSFLTQKYAYSSGAAYRRIQAAKVFALFPEVLEFIHQGKCCYQSPSGKQCESEYFLEVDHIEPFSLGGKTNIENLRLLCQTHNRYRAEKTFGERGG